MSFLPIYESESFILFILTQGKPEDASARGTEITVNALTFLRLSQRVFSGSLHVKMRRRTMANVVACYLHVSIQIRRFDPIAISIAISLL